MANVAEYRGIQVPRTWWKLVLTAFGRRFEVIRADAPISDPLLKVARGRYAELYMACDRALAPMRYEA